MATNIQTVFRRPGEIMPEEMTFTSLEEASVFGNSLRREMHKMEVFWWAELDRLRNCVKEAQAEAQIHYREILICHELLEEYADRHNEFLCSACKLNPPDVQGNLEYDAFCHYDSPRRFATHGDVLDLIDFDRYDEEIPSADDKDRVLPTQLKCCSLGYYNFYPRVPCKCLRCKEAYPRYIKCDACSRGNPCESMHAGLIALELKDQFLRCMCAPCRATRHYYKTTPGHVRMRAENKKFPLYEKNGIQNFGAFPGCNCRYCGGKQPTNLDAIHYVQKQFSDACI
jgi:hypothetical protein